MHLRLRQWVRGRTVKITTLHVYDGQGGLFGVVVWRMCAADVTCSPDGEALSCEKGMVRWELQGGSGVANS